MFRCLSRPAMAGVGFLLFGVLPLSAQQDVSYHDLLVGIRDTVTTVEAAVRGFNKDVKGVGAETVLARAIHLRAKCMGAAPSLAAARKRMQSAVAVPRLRRDAAALIDAIVSLERTLTSECERGFREGGPGHWPDSLRAWGPYRGSQITTAIRAYESAAAKFASAAGITIPPR